MNYTFTSIDMDGVKSTREFEADCWFDALDEFVNFLKGSGYSIPTGTVGLNVCTTFFEPDLDSNLTIFEGDE
jgi:hypothetical protein